MSKPPAAHAHNSSDITASLVLVAATILALIFAIAGSAPELRAGWAILSATDIASPQVSIQTLCPGPCATFAKLSMAAAGSAADSFYRSTVLKPGS